MIRKTYELQTSVADQNDVLAAILDLIDMPLFDNEALQWSLVDTGFNCYLEVHTDEYTDVYTRLYECDLSDLGLNMEAILDALNETFESVDNESYVCERDLFLKYE